MMFPWADGSKGVNRDWHEGRITARQHSFSEEEWAESKQIKWDLETAGVTGKDNNRTYIVTRDIPTPEELPNGTDVRTLEDR